MKKQIILLVAVVLVSSVLFGRGLELVSEYNHKRAMDYCDKLTKTDDDGDGYACWTGKKGLAGYKVVFYRSIRDDEPEVYNFGW